MSKAVMLSIQPKWCELIASGAKTIEVRKTRPQIETPFKCYIYETKAKGKQSYFNVYHENTIGKVVGEFICDRIETIDAQALHDYILKCEASYEDGCKTNYALEIISNMQLSSYALSDYLGYKNGYGWHISDLVIYDKPRELGEFNGKCKIEGWHFCTGKSPLTRPPQSWCYVEAN